MSFDAEKANSFIGPLTGKTTTFILDGRIANQSFAYVVMSLLAQIEHACLILDLDAFYSSNSNLILGQTPISHARTTMINVPDPGSSIEKEFPRIFTTNPGSIIIIDSLNTFHHLLSSEDGSSRSRKLSFAVASLSYLASADNKAVIITMYKRDGSGRIGANRSISRLSDVTASVEVHGSELSIKCQRGRAWPGGSFSIQMP